MNMKLIKMFTILFILSVATLGLSAQEMCRKIPINDDKVYGECCVFRVDEDLPNDKKENLSPIRNRKSRQPSQVQRIKEVQPLQANTNLFLSPKPIIAASHTGRDKSNVFVPASFHNLVVPFENDKLFGECDVFVKDKSLPREIIAAIIQENLSMKEHFEERHPPPASEKLPIIQSPKSTLHFNLSSISRKNREHLFRPENQKTVYLPENFEDEPDEEISDRQEDTDKAHKIGFDNLDEEFNESTTKIYPEISSTYDSFTRLKDTVKYSTTLKPHTDGSTFFTDITEEVDEAITSSEIPDEPYFDIVGDGKSNDTVFPVREYTMKDLNSNTSNTNSSGKAVVDLDNRNAIDVPPVACPSGQGRDPSGVCVWSF